MITVNTFFVLAAIATMMPGVFSLWRNAFASLAMF